MKEIPESWYVHYNKENLDTLREWRGGDFSFGGDNIVMCSDKYWARKDQLDQQSYTEITFNEFLQIIGKNAEQELYEIY